MNQELAVLSSPTRQNLHCRCSSLAAGEGASWRARTCALHLGVPATPLPASAGGSPLGVQGPGLCFHLLGSQPLVYCLVGLKGLIFLGLAGATSWVNIWEQGSSRKGTLGDPGETSCPQNAPSRDGSWHCQVRTALPQSHHVWRGWRWQLQGRAMGNCRAPRLFPAGEGTQEELHRDPQQPRAQPG